MLLDYAEREARKWLSGQGGITSEVVRALLDGLDAKYAQGYASAQEQAAGLLASEAVRYELGGYVPVTSELDALVDSLAERIRAMQQEVE